MIGALIGLLIWLLVAGVVYWAAMAVIALIPLPAPFAQIVRVIVILIVALIIINALLGLTGAGLHSGPLFRY